MVKIFPFIFIVLWSSAFVTTKPIIDNSDPFAALAFRFFVVAFGFYIFSIYTKQKISTNLRNLLQSLFSGVLFHGVYLGGCFLFSFNRNAHGYCCINCNPAANFN
ncbi:EamA family transporter [Candidatus Pelagibacter sp.]|nr:EamA family transporter [Candidatus Pelagibacter sp.]